VVIRSHLSMMALFLSLVVTFSTLFTSPIAYAEENPPTRAGPQNLRIAENSLAHNSATLNWDFIDGDPNEIDVWHADTNNWLAWANLEKKEIALEPETTYRIYITWNKDRPSLEYKSNIIEFTTPEDLSQYPAPPLTPPSNLHVTSISEDSISLGWGASPNANAYDIYVNDQWAGGTWSQTATASTYTPENGFLTGHQYSFEVGAQNLPKVSVNSNAVTITWGELAAPQDLQVVTATRTDVALGWAPVPGATSYNIYIDDNLAGASSDNRYLATGLKEGQTYSFKVEAQNELWKSLVSNEITAVPGANYNIITYYTSWSVSESARNFKPLDIDATQITHINYAFSDLCWKGSGTGGLACQNDKIPLQKDYVFDGEMVLGDHDNDISNLAQFRAIREDNPHLKLLVSVGGWSWSKNFSNMAADEINRRLFANSVVDFLREYELNGIDIDWEYPVEDGEEHNSRSPEDKQNFTLLMQAVREALDAAGSVDGQYYLLTIASGQGDNFVNNADLANSSAYLDFINIMTYDYSGSWEKLAHHNAPLFYDRNHPRASAARNHITGGALGHLNGGVPQHKLVLGIPLYGKGWVGCPEPGQYATCESSAPFGTWENGIFDFTDIELNYLNEEGYTHYWNEASKAAYIFNPKNGVFITYNDQTSMMYNASLVKTLNIAGVMSWEISGDRNRTLTTQLAADLPINGAWNNASLPAPAHLSLASKEADSLTIQWDAALGATHYEIYTDYIWQGTTSETQYTLQSLQPNTSYNIHIIAVKRSGTDDSIQQVSAANHAIQAVTLAPQTPSGPSTPIVNQPSDVLPAAISRSGDSLSANVSKDSAIAAIKRSTAHRFRILVTDKANKIEVTVPKEVWSALYDKNDQAELSIITDQVEYRIPMLSSLLNSTIRITIEAPSPLEKDQLSEAALAEGLKLLLEPLHYKIEAVNADGSTTEITDFDHRYLSRVYTLKDEQFKNLRTTGAVFTPDTKEFHPVPTVIHQNADGTISIELKRSGNSLYTIATTNESSFEDVTAGWARADILQAAAKLLISAQGEGLFGANDNITRAEFISLVVKSLGFIPQSELTSFKDVSSDTRFAKEIAAALNEGLIRGKAPDTFDPDGLITRQEMAAVLANAIHYASDMTLQDATVVDRYSDKTAMAAYVRDSIALMVENKIMQGVSDTAFAPKAYATRAQATVAVMRMLRSLQLSN